MGFLIRPKLEWALILLFFLSQLFSSSSSPSSPSTFLNSSLSTDPPPHHHLHNKTLPKCSNPNPAWSHRQKCSHIKSYCSNSEESPGLINYLDFYYCTMGGYEIYAQFFLLVHLVFLFVFLGTVASDYFCPNLSTLSKALRFPPDITGVTFLALGNSAPDLFSSIVAIHSAGSVGLAFGELIGAGLFVGGVVLGAVALSARFPSDPSQTHVTLNRSVFLRDLGFLITSMVIMGFIMADGFLHWWESLIALALYGLYISFIVVRYMQRNRDRTRTIRSRPPASRKSTRQYLSSAMSNLSIESVPLLFKSRSRAVTNASQLSRKSSMADSVCDRIVNEHLEGPRRKESINSAIQFMDAVNANEKYKDSVSLRNITPKLCPICARIPSDDVLVGPEKRVIFIIARHFFPILWTWKFQGVFGRIIGILNFPATFLLSLTVPVVACPEDDELNDTSVNFTLMDIDSCGSCSDSDHSQCAYCGRLNFENEEAEERRVWSDNIEEEAYNDYSEQKEITKVELEWHFRWIVIFQAFSSPFFILFAIGCLNYNFGTETLPFYGIYVALIAATVGSLTTFIMTYPPWHYKIYGYTPSEDTLPFRHPIVSCFGFIVGIFWIYLVANEVVGLLKSLGRIFSISGAILGITVFAFGNSIGDLVSNVTMARMGYPTMSISASLAGPFINILITIGVSGIWNMGKGPLVIPLSTNLLLSFCGLFLMLIIDLIVIPLRRYRVEKTYGAIMLIFYVSLISITVFCDWMDWQIPGLCPNEDP